MGGFFGKGKDKGKDRDKDAGDKPQAQVPRPSRRAVIPGGAPATQRISGPAKPPTQRIGAPTAAPPSVFAKPRPPGAAGKSADSDSLVLAPGQTASRPDTTAPIGTSAAPKFAGSLSSGARQTGPCRTGDAALLDFMSTKARLITADQAELIEGKAGRENLPLDQAAVALGIVSEDQLVSALTQECWVPHLKVDKYEIRKKALDTVSREDAVHYSVFPVDKLGSLLTLAMVNPLDQDTIRTLESKTGLDIKRVVATRSEIQQGIDKYYSGQVEAKDTSISFTAEAADIKSVTQLLGRVKTTSDTNDGLDAIAAPAADQSEIQDIDDLLTADEVIAPAIITPKPETAKQVASEEPLVVPAAEVIDLGDAPFSEPPALEARALPTLPATSTPAPEFEDDLPLPEAFIPPPALPKAPPVTARIAAPEFELDDTDALAPAIKPATEAKPQPPAAPAAPPPLFTAPAVPAAPPAPLFSTPPAPRPAPRPPAGASLSPLANTALPVLPPTRVPGSGSAARAVTGSITRPSTGATERPNRTTSMFPARTGTGRLANPKVVNLIPVLEEEFQHAITHGKAHVFEKWVGLQSRNRIINAVAVEAEFDELLATLYEAGRRL